jgi:hypothetical protein
MNTHDPSEALQRSVTAHGLGDIQGASDARSQALQELDEHDPRYPGAVAAYAFTNRLLDEHPLELMVTMAERAYDHGLDIASDETRSSSDRELARREAAASALHAGALVARLGVTYDRNGERQDADEQYSSAADYLWLAKEGARQLRQADSHGLQFLHQWEINTARRHAAVAAFDPEQSALRGLGRAVKAIAMSPFSESSLFVAGANPESTAKAKLRAKAKSFIGGVASGATCVLDMLPGEKAAIKKLQIAESKFVF